MTRLHHFVLGALALTLSMSAAAQGPGTVSGRLVETSSGPYEAGDTFEVTLQLGSDSGSAGVGTSSVVVDFDHAFATFAPSPAEAEDYVFVRYQGAQEGIGGGRAGYTSDVVATRAGRLTVTVDLGYSEGGTGQALPAELVDVVVLRFTVVDPSVASSVAFETVQVYTGPGERYEGGAFVGIDSGNTGGAGVDLILDAGAGWYPLAAPVEGLTVGSLLGGMWTQGFEGASDATATPTVIGYIEAVGGDADAGLRPVTSSSDVVPSGAALFVYVAAVDPARPGAAVFPKTLSLSGREPALPFAFAGLTHTDTGSPPDDGWALLGNPIQDPLNWDAEGWIREGVGGAVYVYSPVDGEYRFWNAGLGTLAGGEVPAGHGFWVQTIGPSPSLVAPEAARASLVGEAGEDGGDPEGVTVVELRLVGPTPAGERGATVVLGFGAEGASVGADGLDAYALVPPGEAFVLAGARRSDGELVALSAMPPLDAVEAEAVHDGVFEVPLAVEAGGVAGGPLVWRWPRGVVGLDAWSVTLVDRQTGDEVDLRAVDAYAFDQGEKATEASRPASDVVPGGRGTVARLVVSEGSDARRTARPLRLTEASSRGGGSPVPLALLPASPSEADRFALRFARLQGVAGEGLPGAFAVAPPAPNPALSAVRLTVSLPEAAEVEAAVFDLLGRRVLSIQAGGRAAGHHEVALDARSLASGVYVVQTRLVPGAGAAHVFTHKLTIVR